MSPKVVRGVIFALTGVFVFGCIGYAVLDSMKSRETVDELEREERVNRKAIADALGSAREKVREGLRKRDAEAAADGDEETVRERMTRSRKLRGAVRRKFFGGGHGVTLSAAYLKACEMPQEDPSEEDQEIIDVAGELLCEADLDTAAEVTEAALKSKDPRARMAAVEMLSALGEAGLVDIGAFLTDDHPEVANLAAERWELGVQDIVDDNERTALVKVGLLAITDEDQLRSMVGTLQMTSDERLIVKTVEEVIREGTKAQRDAVKEAYENLTGEPWKDEKTAEKWLAENYTPPEPEEPADDGDDEDDNSDEESDAN